MTKNRRIFPSAAPEPASPLTEAPRRKRKNWRSWLTIQVESERYQPPRSGILLLQVLVGIFFFVFVTRFWYLQLHLGPEMTTQAQKNRLRTERIFAPRGRIFDDHGNILADNRTAYGLAIIREDCPDIPIFFYTHTMVGSERVNALNMNMLKLVDMAEVELEA